MNQRSCGICVRCRRSGPFARRWPDGPVCARCYQKAGRFVGTCHGCELHRVLPGRHDDRLICAVCAGIDGFVCSVCAAVDEPMDTVTTCQRCLIRRRVVRLVCDTAEPSGTAAVIVDTICARGPRGLAKWVANNPTLIGELRAVATGQHHLTHANLDLLGTSRRVENLRQKLIVAGLLPARHHQLALFDQWTTQVLASIDNTGHRQTIAAFAIWHHRRRLGAAVDNNTLKTASTRAARRQIRVALNFLTWLDQRDITLGACRQSDIDRWFSTGNTTTYTAIGFITWARTQRLCHRDLRLPVYRPGTPTGMTHLDRVEVISRLLHDDSIAIGDRVAGLLVALYAQPVTRICRLRCDTVTRHDDNHSTIQIGAEHIELAHPVAQLTQRLLADPRRNGSTWLFPGTTAGQPRSSHSLGERLRLHGVTRETRVAALHDLIQQIPSPVLARLIGYNATVIANRANTLASPWDHYASIRSTNFSPH